MMLEAYKQLVTSQFEAALATLGICIDRCPQDAWSVRVGNCPFGQVAFHTLFFADYYLGAAEHAYADQPFHREHRERFGDYEELQDREPNDLHDRDFVQSYLEHCRDKVRRVMPAETAESLQARAAFARRDFSRAELHVYNLRHVQHHTAQLSLRLRLDFGEDVPWVGSGWRDV